MASFNVNSDLFLGSQELNRLLKFLDDDGFRKLLLQNSLSFGIINNSKNGEFDSFKVQQGTNPGFIKIPDGLAIDAAGQLITYHDTELELTNDNSWYWVTIAHEHDKREQGVCSIDANGNLSFPGGELTQILRGLPNNPVKVSFTNASVNIQEYEVVEVISDENAVLAGDFSAESNLRLAVVGAFTPDTVVPADSKYPFQYDGCDLSVTLETILNTPPTLIADYEFTIARVKRNGSTITIQDKRGDIYRTKADFSLSGIGISNNPLIGVEAVKYNNNLTPRDQNLVYLAWGFRSSNWTIDSSTNRLTLIAGLGGKFKTTSDFTDGDFDNWRVYTKDGSYSIVKQSSLSATQINLILDVLDPDKFTDITQQLVVVPDADEIELIFAADSTDATDLLDKRFIFHINNGQVIVPLIVYKSPSCNYNFKYRYKSFRVWSEAVAIPSDSVGYFIESNFSTSGVQAGSVRQAYTSNDVLGFITLTLATNAYSNRITDVETGDLFGVEYLALDNADPINNLIVGTNMRYQVVTNDDDLDASDSDYGSTFILTVDHYINLSTLLTSAIQNGNSFVLQFRGEYIKGAFDIFIVQDYVNPGDTGIPLYTLQDSDYTSAYLDGLTIDCIFDGTRWFVHKQLTGQVPQGRTLTAGNGLSGGGDLTADRVFTVNVDTTTIEIIGDSLRIATGAAGSGLSGGGGSALAVNVDASSIEINSDTLRVKALGITNAMLAGSILPSKLSEDVIQCIDSIQLHSSVFQIGDWKMDTTSNVSVSISPINQNDIRSITVLIRADGGGSIFLLPLDAPISISNADIYMDANIVHLARVTGGFFDDALYFGDTGYNRGFITILHIPT